MSSPSSTTKVIAKPDHEDDDDQWSDDDSDFQPPTVEYGGDSDGNEKESGEDSGKNEDEESIGSEDTDSDVSVDEDDSSKKKKIIFKDETTLEVIDGATVSSQFKGKEYSTFEDYKKAVQGGSVLNDVYLKVTLPDVSGFLRGVKLKNGNVMVLTSIKSERLAISSIPGGDTKLTPHFAANVIRDANKGKPLKRSSHLIKIFGKPDAKTDELPCIMSVALANDIKAQKKLAEAPKPSKEETPAPSKSTQDTKSAKRKRQTATEKSPKKSKNDQPQEPRVISVLPPKALATTAVKPMAEKATLSAAAAIKAYEEAGKTLQSTLAKQGLKVVNLQSNVTVTSV